MEGDGMRLEKGSRIAHRGLWDNETIPENSMKAFQKAIQNSYPIELDVQLTKDNVLVVFHDYNLKRMTGVPIYLQESTFQEIEECPLLMTKERIPTFQSVLDLVKDKVFLDIEIKQTKKIALVCDTLMKELGDFSNFVIKSFDPRIVRYLKTHYPNVEVGYLIHKKYPTWWQKILLPSSFMLWYTKTDFLAIHKKLLELKKYQKLSKKYPIFLWTIQDTNEIQSPDFIYVGNYYKKKND